MKKFIIIILTVLSCGNPSKHRMTKPFIVVNKSFDWDDSKTCKYFYQDSFGFEYSFVDINEKYNIGDTIK